jgi:transcriptional regulator with XRE-family HTH domain
MTTKLLLNFEEIVELVQLSGLQRSIPESLGTEWTRLAYLIVAAQQDRRDEKSQTTVDELVQPTMAKVDQYRQRHTEYNQRELADLLGISLSYYLKMRSGERKVGQDVCDRLKDLFEVEFQPDLTNAQRLTTLLNKAADYCPPNLAHLLRKEAKSIKVPKVPGGILQD